MGKASERCVLECLTGHYAYAQAQITRKRAMLWCQSKGNMPYFETSAKEDKEVEAMVVDTVLGRSQRGQAARAAATVNEDGVQQKRRKTFEVLREQFYCDTCFNIWRRGGGEREKGGERGGGRKQLANRGWG